MTATPIRPLGSRQPDPQQIARAKADFQRSPELQAEFQNEERYVAYALAALEDRAKIYKKMAVTYGKTTKEIRPRPPSAPRRDRSQARGLAAQTDRPRIF